MGKLSFVDLLAAIINQVEANTGKKCYDIVPNNAPLPHYAAEIVRSDPDPSKTMLKEKYQVILHAWADGESSSIPVLDMVRDLEAALTEEINLPGNYEVTMQVPKGLQGLSTDPDGSKHGIVSYEFTIFYGYKMKV